MKETPPGTGGTSAPWKRSGQCRMGEARSWGGWGQEPAGRGSHPPCLPAAEREAAVEVGAACRSGQPPRRAGLPGEGRPAARGGHGAQHPIGRLALLWPPVSPSMLASAAIGEERRPRRSLPAPMRQASPAAGHDGRCRGRFPRSRFGLHRQRPGLTGGSCQRGAVAASSRSWPGW